MNHANHRWLLAVLVFLWPLSTIQAGPIFQWQDSWDVRFVHTSENTTQRSNFGISATQNGEITNIGNAGDIGPATAFVRAFVHADSGFFSDSSGMELVSFSRIFRLSGSPNGWDVSVTGFLNGLLTITQNPSVNPKAEIDAITLIDENLGGGGGPSLSTLDIKGTTTGFVATPGGNGILSFPDGTYQFMGFLTASASIEAALTSGGVAESDFYTGSRGLTITVNATPRQVPLPPPPPPPPPPLLVEAFGPATEFVVFEDIPVVPEPGTLLLALTALVGLLPGACSALGRRKEFLAKAQRTQRREGQE
jgi:hypothetical protein